MPEFDSLTWMPKILQIRGVPDDTHQKLRTKAAAAGMSLSRYALTQLIEIADRPTLSEVLGRAAARGRPANLSTKDILDARQQGRRDRV
jgi:plasmid stability protein